MNPMRTSRYFGDKLFLSELKSFQKVIMRKPVDVKIEYPISDHWSHWTGMAQRIVVSKKDVKL